MPDFLQLEVTAAFAEVSQGVERVGQDEVNLNGGLDDDLSRMIVVREDLGLEK